MPQTAWDTAGRPPSAPADHLYSGPAQAHCSRASLAGASWPVDLRPGSLTLEKHGGRTAPARHPPSSVPQPGYSNSLRRWRSSVAPGVIASGRTLQVDGRGGKPHGGADHPAREPLLGAEARTPGPQAHAGLGRTAHLHFAPYTATTLFWLGETVLAVTPGGGLRPPGFRSSWWTRISWVRLDHSPSLEPPSTGWARQGWPGAGGPWIDVLVTHAFPCAPPQAPTL